MRAFPLRVCSLWSCDSEAQNTLDEMLKTSGGEGENVTDMELLEEEAKLDLEKRTTVKTVQTIAV